MTVQVPPMTHWNLADVRHGHHDDIPPHLHGALVKMKAEAAERGACQLQDAMNVLLPIYIGDGRLFELKRAVQDALDQLRYTAEGIRHRGDSNAETGGRS